jgi:outer membrane protein OmpA-like peptidoglycan-associated protein
MKQLILLTLTFCYSINSFSQVGIGTAEPNASSQLEVKADDKGVLLPQVALQSTTDNNTISNGNVVSLLVYNTNNSDDLKAGYYFWDGSKWMSLGSQSSVSIDGGTGAPDDDNPANPQGGDIYVDNETGDIYTHNGDEWVQAGSGSGSTTTPGAGSPNEDANGPSDPQAGDLYVDTDTGDIYTYSGDQWTNKSKVVSEEDDNVIEEDDNGLAFLPPAALESAMGKTSGSGPPSENNPTNPQGGDLYVDETNGDIYTHNGDEWVQSGSGGGSTTTPGAGSPNEDANGPSDPQAGDLYVDTDTGDIYTYSGDQWTNNSKVVSEEDDMFPFVDADGVIYFSSDGHSGLGGLDVFYAKPDGNGGFGDVQNMGKPINSPFDDFVYVSNTQKGYFASNRDNQNDDIFSFALLDTLADPCRTIFKGVLTNKKTNLPIPNATLVFLNSKQDEVGRVEADEDGYYSYRDDVCGNIKAIRFLHDDYFADEVFVSGNEGGVVQTEIALDLRKLAIEEETTSTKTDLAMLLNPIYFDLNKSFIREDAKIELEKIIGILNQHPLIKIDVRAHTDSRGLDSFNLALSNRRAKSTIKYMIDRGIDPDRITGRGYGESELINNCSDGVVCQDYLHEQNRRSEFIIVKK